MSDYKIIKILSIGHEKNARIRKNAMVFAETGAIEAIIG
jgi:hypothetical protein